MNGDVVPPDFNQPKLGLCWSLSQFHAQASAGTPSWICIYSSLKLPPFCCLGRHSFGKDAWCSPYLHQVTNPSFPHTLAWLCLLAQGHPPRGKSRFGLTETICISKQAHTHTTHHMTTHGNFSEVPSLSLFRAWQASCTKGPDKGKMQKYSDTGNFEGRALQ